MRKYIFAGILICSLCCFKAFGQESDYSDVILSDETTERSLVKKRIIDFTVKLPTSFYLNHLDEEMKKIAAPSPLVFMPGIGLIVPNHTLFSFEPAVSIYCSYYQWANGINGLNGMAVPAEIENRTATTVSVLLDLPIAVSLSFQKSKLQFSLGPAALMRFAYLARDVHSDDYGASGNAADDVKLIKSYFWSHARFFYVSANASWIFNVYKNTKAGPFIGAYFPIGSLTASEGLNGMIASIGLKISF